MLLSGGLTQISQLPQPSLGLLPAVHSISKTDIVLGSDGTAALPNVKDVQGSLLYNATGAAIILPVQGNFPSRAIPAGEFFSSNGTAFYKLRHKPGLTRQVISLEGGVFTTSIPHHFTNGETIALYGFVNSNTTFGAPDGTPGAFSDTGVLYRVAEVDGNTFKIANDDGVVFSDASSGGNSGGWVHTQQSSSYYPAAFERTIYTFPFTLQSLPVGETFTLSRVFSFRTISAQSASVWSVIMEFGQRVDATGPGSVGPNLKAYEYLPPAIDQQVVITDVTTDHSLGISFSRTSGGISGSRLLYSRNSSLIPGTLPLGDDFTLRVRLGQFDIEDQIPDPTGYVAYNVSPNPNFDDSLG